MPYKLTDLTDVMEAETARRVPSPDLMDGVRRRVRRGNRLRAAAGALGVMLVAGVSFGAVQGLGGPDGSDPGRRSQALAPPAAGVADDAFPKSRSVEGLAPVKEVRFSTFGQLARVTFTPTGPFTMFRAQCSTEARWYRLEPAMGSSGCGGESYRTTTPGVPITIETTVLPAATARSVGDMVKKADLTRYLASHSPTPGDWSLQVYSGECGRMCKEMTTPRRAPVQPSVDGLKRLAQAEGTADGRTRTVPLKGDAKSLRLRVTCVDGAAHAVVRIGGSAKLVECEAPEANGIVWDAQAAGGADGIEIAVLPAEAGLHSTGDAALAKAMKGVKPAGTWTLEVYAR